MPFQMADELLNLVAVQSSHGVGFKERRVQSPRGAKGFSAPMSGHLSTWGKMAGI
jgi:hypothetical protein